jgi:hypothetical protein
MRRALLLFIAATPALALGQTAGSVVFSTNGNSNLVTINRAQCSGTQNTDAALSDDMTATVGWTIKPVNSAVSAGTYRILLSQTQSEAGQTTSGSTTGKDCTKDTNGGAISTFMLVDDQPVSGQTQTVQNVSLATVTTKLGLDCTTATQVNVYVCVQQIDASNSIVGYATLTLALDRTVPPAPINVKPTPGDGVLHVGCQKSSGDSLANGGFKAKAMPTNSTMATGYSGESSSCSDLLISGLTNSQAYDVVVYRLNANHNPSLASASASGTPIPTSDGWGQYKGDGGREAGGCSTGAGAIGLLGALSFLVALRRRKS